MEPRPDAIMSACSIHAKSAHEMRMNSPESCSL
jgi:hypothetical protein